MNLMEMRAQIMGNPVQTQNWMYYSAINIKEELMKPSFYLAGKYSDREELCAYASALRANGFYVNAEWLEGEHEARDAKSQAKYAHADFADIRNSDRFLVIQNTEQSAGRNIELGYALAQGKHTTSIGRVTSVFHHVVAKQFPTFDAFLEDLKAQFQ